MGTGKKKIEIEKIMKETSRMVTFSKRRKGLFKKAKELESMTGSRVASVVFSPTGRPYTCGDVNFAIQQHFSSIRCMELLISGPNYDFDSDSGLKLLSNSNSSGLRRWVEGIDVEQYQNLNYLLMLKQQLEGTREKIGSIEQLELFEALFV
ncbi:agamous-like MADS-box protein AGL29 [Solanum lycopersicum]|uniref:agamous-like MADS-box protein AGL29 n=1 Tax=Solanum lycopersicum TaxID=4081 RepID=UPI0002BCC0E6|nr:agamous-like MADS-box protein AGL29 [Solanum lycopersicum]